MSLAPPPPDDDPEGFAALLDQVTRARGFRCGSYKERCLRRRVAVRLRATGTHTFADYARLLAAEPAEYDRLLDVLTINVTKLFRDVDAWAALAERAIPRLWARHAGALRVWSAGCASGEEAYSVAALLHAHAERAGELARLAEVEVLGTDVDRASLASAARGAYGPGAFADAPAALRARYFSTDEPAEVAPELRRLVRFASHDLLAEPPPPGPWHLVICRNVVIYLDRASQEALFERFHLALAPGGALFLGKVETLLGAARTRYVPLDARHRIFERP